MVNGQLNDGGDHEQRAGIGRTLASGRWWERAAPDWPAPLLIDPKTEVTS